MWDCRGQSGWRRCLGLAVVYDPREEDRLADCEDIGRSEWLSAAQSRAPRHGLRASALLLVGAAAVGACIWLAQRERPSPAVAPSSASAASSGLAQLAETPRGGAHHPRYALVDGRVETLWQRPPGALKGIVFIAHGCHHQGPDVFDEVGPHGWRFEDCRRTKYGHCLGLPEERHVRDAALARGYLVVAVSGGTGLQSCWQGADVANVKAAVRHVRAVEELPEDLPVFAVGASVGGLFVGFLAQPDGLPHLRCIVPQVSGVDTYFGNWTRKIPTLFVHMPLDGMTEDAVADGVIMFKDLGTRVADLKVEPRPVTRGLLEACMGADLAEDVVAALRSHGALDDKGLLKEDPREKRWVDPVKHVMHGRSNDTLVPDESCTSERLNVAWAFHEFTGQYAEEMLDFCEETGAFAPSRAARAAAAGAHPPPEGAGSRGSSKLSD